MKKIDNFIGMLGLIVICVVMSSIALSLSIECKDLNSALSAMEVQTEKTPFIFTDNNSGFLSASDVMASYEVFEAPECNSAWVRVEKSGFGQAHEFSVDTVQEAEMILRGLI